MTINEQLLKQYIHNFYGYGNLDGRYWCIGMEEGGGNSAEEVQSRINHWKNQGAHATLDIYRFHQQIHNREGQAIDHWFQGKQSKYQPTWGGLIKTLLTAKTGKLPTLAEVKQFQSEGWGRTQSDTCLLEVFPLPSPSSGEFLYANWGLDTLPYLKTRERYKQEIKDKRINQLRQLIQTHRPKLVHFYSSNPEYIEYWSAISEVDLDRTRPVVIARKPGKELVARISRKNGTCFLVTHHPTYTGISNKYHEEVGKLVKENID